MIANHALNHVQHVIKIFQALPLLIFYLVEGGVGWGGGGGESLAPEAKP